MNQHYGYKFIMPDTVFATLCKAFSFQESQVKKVGHRVEVYVLEAAWVKQWLQNGKHEFTVIPHNW